MFSRAITSIVSKRQAPVAAPARRFGSDAHGHHASAEDKLFTPLSSGSFYTAFGVLAATFGYLTYKKAAEPEVFPVYKVVLDEEVRIGKRNADYTINPTYVPKAPQAAKDGF